MALDNVSPNPNWVEFDLWYDFGFVLCSNEYDEGNFVTLYRMFFVASKLFRDYDESLGVPSNIVSNSPSCSFGEF
jgi:hypothetical protein